MERILCVINDLKDNEIKKVIDKRILEFKNLGMKGDKELFSELCFCLLTANFNAERGIKIQNELKDGFLNLSEKELANGLKRLGHRFPNMRAKFIVEARKYYPGLKKRINSFKDEKEAREFLVNNVKGLGYKESSHFLRNIGYENLAILDFHIIDILNEYCKVEKPKTLTKKKYLEIEDFMKGIAKNSKLNLAELDLYLWYKETGTVLK